MKEIAIKTNNPVEADKLLQQFGVLMEGGGTEDESKYKKDKKGNFKARCIGDLDYVKFVLKNQGYSFVEIID